MYICNKGHKVRDRDRTDSQLNVSSSTAHFTKTDIPSYRLRKKGDNQNNQEFSRLLISVACNFQGFS